MGVVYKAEDTKLERTVALKFLAAHLLDDEEAKARFFREARAAAGLHHPNICPVYEIDEAKGKTFLSMAFIKGDSLEARIEQGPLPLKEALDVGRQIAEGLEAAYEEGVVHRDIKPANVMVDAKGRATIMDFGLAHLAEASRLTKADQTMGTVAYMSPEQAQGMEVDNRSDVWALGVVLYEMVCGQRPFQGQYDQALLYEIVHQEPEPLTGVRAGVPMELEFIVGKCLAKDRNDRPSSAEEIARDLRTLGEKLKSGRSTVLHTGIVTGPPAGSTQLTGQAGRASQPHPLVKYRVIEDGQETGDAIRYVAEDTELRQSVAIRVLPQSSEQQIERSQRRKQAIASGAGALGLLLGLIIALFAWLSPASEDEAALRRFTITPPVPLLTFTRGSGIPNDNFVSISPNARHIAFIEDGDERRLWIQDLDQVEPRVLEGTEGAISPFWSPDSAYVGFAAGGDVKKVSVRGGPPSRVCELPHGHFHGGTWSPDGEVIVFSSGNVSRPHNLYEIPARGGAATVLLSSNDLPDLANAPGQYPAWAHFLPAEAGPRLLLFSFGFLDEETIAVQDLTNGDRKILGPGCFPIYSRSGHVLYQTTLRSNDLWAVPFSLETLQATGEAFPVSANTRDASVATHGTLVYVEISESSALRQLAWFDREGNRVEEIGEPREGIRFPALSPDGGRLAVTEASVGDVWVHDLVRGTRTRISNSSGSDFLPVWSPGGDQVAYTSRRSGSFGPYLRQADGGGQEEKVAVDPYHQVLSDWSQDGKYLLGHQAGQGAIGDDLWYFERAGSDDSWESRPFLREPAEQRSPMLSPDGRYVAYLSNESGQREVYVLPFPEGGRKVTVSTNGASQVRWSRDGRELFYAQESTLMAVPVSTEEEFSAGTPQPLFTLPLWIQTGFPNYDVSLDRQTFILPESVGGDPGAAAGRKIRVVENWYEEFRDRQ